MAITNGYIALIELQQYVDATGQAQWTTADVRNQEQAIEAASRWIDDYMGTRFYSTTSDETRVYNAPDWRMLPLVDDLISVTSIKIDDDDDGIYEITLSASDYILHPLNAPLDNLPYRWIEMNDDSQYSWPRGVQNGVEIVGKFGFVNNDTATNAPSAVRQACLIIAHHFWIRKNRPAGTGGTGAIATATSGTIVPPDALAILDGVPRRGGFF